MMRAGLAGLVVASAAWGQCVETWSDVFTPAVFSGGDEAECAVFDDGSGARLVVTDLARFGAAPGLQVWDGAAWGSLAYPGMEDDRLGTLHAFNQMDPPVLVGVLGTTSIAEEVLAYSDGGWQSLGFPTQSGIRFVSSFAPGPDPSSGEFYMSGLMRIDGEYSKVLRWDGEGWSALDSGGDSASVTSLAWFDDGSGLALYAGVRTAIDGVPAAGVARWDGVSWSEVGGGCPAFWPTVAVHDDGSGEALWALGSDGETLARWDGLAWTAHALEPATNHVSSWRLLSTDLGGRRELLWVNWVRGASELRRWDGAAGERLTGTSGGWAYDIEPDVSGDLGGGLLATGGFRRAGETVAVGAAGFDGAAWRPLGTGEAGNGAPRAGALLSVGDEGGPEIGGRVYVASDTAAGEVTGGVASWDGQAWTPIGPGEGEWVGVDAIALGDLGEGPRLFADAYFGDAGARLMAWDGSAWSPVGGEIEGGSIGVMKFGTLGGAPQLFVGGNFGMVGGERFNSVAAVDAGGFTDLGGGLPGVDGRMDSVLALEIHDDGTGPALYAGGFLDDQPLPLNLGVVRWNGSAWARAGGQLGPRGTNVNALRSADLGEGSLLYAGGDIRGVGGEFNNVIVWDGSAWYPVGTGVDREVTSLEVLETDDGPRLAATTYASGAAPGERVFLWDGHAWSPLGAEIDGSVLAAAQAAHEGGALYLAGTFTEVAGVPSEGVARLGCECVADFNGDGVVDTRDFISYLGAWSAGDARADLTGDGLVDSRDFIAFLGAWSAGC